MEECVIEEITGWFYPLVKDDEVVIDRRFFGQTDEMYGDIVRTIKYIPARDEYHVSTWTSWAGDYADDGRWKRFCPQTTNVYNIRGGKYLGSYDDEETRRLREIIADHRTKGENFR